MGVTPAVLANRYPRLYHMAHATSWDGIKQHGLLSTTALLDLFQIPPRERIPILAQQRTRSVDIHHPIHGNAVIRDQKPLSRSKLEGCLSDCSFIEWLNLLNTRVFFWLTEARLLTLMCAKEYCEQNHVVLTLDTLKVSTDYENSITLAPMNTGSTRPYAHPRGLSTFSRMKNYPYAERLGRGLDYTVVELAVEGGIPNILDYAITVREVRCRNCNSKPPALATVRTLFPTPD